MNDRQPNQIVPQHVGGLGHDVRVPLAVDRYDAITIKRMVKLVNRRGRVRWFDHSEGRTLAGQIEREWRCYKPPSEKIAGLDEHIDFINDALSSHRELGLFVSFEDSFEARRFVSDMAVLNATAEARPKPTKQEIAEQARREALAQRHSQITYPQGPVLRVSEHKLTQVKTWCVMVAAGGRSPVDIDRWMRTNLVGRYWAATWLPGQPPRYQQASYRYYRLSVETWKALIGRSRDEDSKLIVAFQLGEDRDRFNECLGPSSFLKR